MKDLFIQFLQEHNLYYRFSAYCSVHTKISLDEYLDTIVPEFYLSSAFSWSKTDEGHDFWSDVDDAWYKYREEHTAWEYKITFKSKFINTKDLYEDIEKLLSQKYGVEVKESLKVFGKEA